MGSLAEVPVPCYCPRCPLPAYCSAACREADSFHRPSGPECGRPWTVLLPVEALAALRLARRLRREQGGGEPPAQGSLQQGSDSSRDGQSAAAAQVASLGTHLEEMDAEEAAQLAALAAVAHATWQQAAAEAGLAAGGGGGSSAGAEAESSVSIADVLEALCRLQINGLAVVPPERSGSSDRLALALYPVGCVGGTSGMNAWLPGRCMCLPTRLLASCPETSPVCERCGPGILPQVGSLMNHSCQPNVAVRFEVRRKHEGGRTLCLLCL